MAVFVTYSCVLSAANAASAGVKQPLQPRTPGAVQSIARPTGNQPIKTSNTHLLLVKYVVRKLSADVVDV